jgi:molybdenum cofactor synthesis domain-containing protein
MTSLPLIDSIAAKLDGLRQRLRRNETETLELSRAFGRVLAQNVLAFRDSPSLDVSAMDGYAVRESDLSAHAEGAPIRFPVLGLAKAGSPPWQLKLGSAAQIFTGGVVPIGADIVIPREQCDETAEFVTIRTPRDQLQLGQHIRRRAENARMGSIQIESGCTIDGPRVAGIATFAQSPQIEVYRPLRVAIINTGDELIEPNQPILPWQIRDSNGPLLESMLRTRAWAQVTRHKVVDDPDAIAKAIRWALQSSDAILLTGGVSMGDTDYVPQSILQCGGSIGFHRLPIRPGKPVLGAVGSDGQLIMGLPGNPVSVAVTFRRYALMLLETMAGLRSATVPTVQVESQDSKTLDLIWFRLVTLSSHGTAVIASTQGSGDIASLSHSDGFVEIPIGASSNGRWPYYAW